MLLDSKGRVTIPAALRAKFNLRAGDEVDVVEVDGTLRIVRAESSLTAGQRAVQRLRGTANSKDVEGMSTDAIMALLRGE
ncbi:AbrB/MazE/SpoVT family DNA-binding domain-containing protein [Streptomyces sp. NPDC002577]